MKKYLMVLLLSCNTKSVDQTPKCIIDYINRETNEVVQISDYETFKTDSLHCKSKTFEAIFKNNKGRIIINKVSYKAEFLKGSYDYWSFEAGKYFGRIIIENDISAG